MLEVAPVLGVLPLLWLTRRSHPFTPLLYWLVLAHCVVMTVSSCYELIEWLVAVLIGQGADEFLGTQGDVWDTQWDMFMALIGGSTSLLLLSHRQDRQLRG